MNDKLMFQPDAVCAAPPQSEPVEESILGSCIVSPVALETACRTLRPEHFYSTLHQVIFQTILDIRYHGESVDCVSLCERLHGSDEEKNSKVDYAISCLVEGVETSPNIGTHTKILLEKHRLRSLRDAGIHLQQAVDAGDAEAVDRVQAEIAEIKKQDFSAALIFSPNWKNAPEKHAPLLTLNGIKILSRGNICLITAGAGHGKSSVIECMLSSAINSEADSLGLSLNSKNNLYLDTERSHEDHFDSWTRFMYRNGLKNGDPAPDGVRWENLRGIERLENRLSYLWSVIDTAEVVLIDGIGDFVADPNDSTECTRLISKLCSIIHTNDSGAVLTLHNNPLNGKEKARGVLGSELWRKSQSVLIIEKLNDSVRRLTTDYSLGKNRSGSDALSSFFCWDVEKGMHVSCDEPEAKEKGKTLDNRNTIVDAMKNQSWPYNDLKGLIMNISNKSDRTAKRWISELVGMRKITKGADNTYTVFHDDRSDWFHD